MAKLSYYMMKNEDVLDIEDVIEFCQYHGSRHVRLCVYFAHKARIACTLCVRVQAKAAEVKQLLACCCGS